MKYIRVDFPVSLPSSRILGPSFPRVDACGFAYLVILFLHENTCGNGGPRQSNLMRGQLPVLHIKSRDPTPSSLLPESATGPVAVWHSSNSVGCISEVTLHRAQTVLEWVIVFGHATISVCNQPPRPTQPAILCGTENECRPKCDDAVRLAVKSGMAHSTCACSCGGGLCVETVVPDKFDPV